MIEAACSQRKRRVGCARRFAFPVRGTFGAHPRSISAVIVGSSSVTLRRSNHLALKVIDAAGSGIGTQNRVTSRVTFGPVSSRGGDIFFPGIERVAATGRLVVTLAADPAG